MILSQDKEYALESQCQECDNTILSCICYHHWDEDSLLPATSKYSLNRFSSYHANLSIVEQTITY